MRVLIVCLVLLTAAACSDNRIYEQNVDLEQRQWLVGNKPSFEFEVTDPNVSYNLYANVRNSVDYPYSRLFFTYYLRDSSGVELQKTLMNEFLFDAKTGKPFGKSGLGDLYDHRFLLLKKYKFKSAGKYSVTFEQFMRMDTLQGMTAVGLRVENADIEP